MLTVPVIVKNYRIRSGVADCGLQATGRDGKETRKSQLVREAEVASTAGSAAAPFTGL